MKTVRKRLISKLDRLSKDVVRKRDGNICVHCGKWIEGSNRHVSHVIPVSGGNRLRWEPLNMKILCYHCHINWWHKNPIMATEWFKTKYPERYKYLKEQQSLGLIKLSIADLEELADKLKKQLN